MIKGIKCLDIYCDNTRQDGSDTVEHPDPWGCPAAEGHSRDEQQEEGDQWWRELTYPVWEWHGAGHQDVDGGRGSVRPGLASSPGVRSAGADAASDQMVSHHVKMSILNRVPLPPQNYIDKELIWFREYSL